MALEGLKQFAKKIRFGRSEPVSPWRKPVTLDRGILGEASMALDGRGRGSALWENGGRLWTMPIGPHSAPAIMRLPMEDGITPRIVLNAEGHGIAVWQTETAGERQILGKILNGEETSARLIFRTDGQIYHLQATVDRRGNALVLWLLETYGRTELMAHLFDTRDLAWEQKPTTLGILLGPAVEPRLAANYRSHAMVLWEVEDRTSEGLVASHYWPADHIWSDRPVPVVSHATRHHQVVMDDLGNALALWVHSPYGQRSSLESSFFHGQSSEWGEPEVLASAHTFTLPRLAMSGNGEALAAWCQSEGRGASRLITKAFGKGRWGAGVECLEVGPGSVKDFAIDLGPVGDAGLLVVHQGPEGDWISARLRHREWSASFPLVPASLSPCSSPQLRLCPKGASAIWIQGAGRERALMLAESVY